MISIDLIMERGLLCGEKGEGTPRGSGSRVLPFAARHTLSRPLKEKPQLVRALVDPGARDILSSSID